MIGNFHNTISSAIEKIIMFWADNIQHGYKYCTCGRKWVSIKIINCKIFHDFLEIHITPEGGEKTCVLKIKNGEALTSKFELSALDWQQLNKVYGGDIAIIGEVRENQNELKKSMIRIRIDEGILFITSIENTYNEKNNKSKIGGMLTEFRKLLEKLKEEYLLGMEYYGVTIDYYLPLSLYGYSIVNKIKLIHNKEISRK